MVGHRLRVGEHDVQLPARGVRRPAPRGRSRARSRWSRPAAARRLSDQQPRALRRRAARRRSSGTSRCGITLVNHEPGPSTTQSAAADRLDGLGAGRRVLGHERDADDPAGRGRDRDLAADRRSSAPSGRPSTTRLDVQRHDATSAAPGPARRAAGPPSPGPRPSRRAAPTARRSAGCRRRARAGRPSLRNRCWRTSLQVRPHSSSPHSAASAIRRSPGGSTPSSRRSRPLEPPSSATVTTAVSWSVTRRSADSEAASPWPPPSATTSGVVPAPRIAGGAAHSRPRSRCDDGDVHAVRRAAGGASSSAMATQRCLPPVQPTATVT